MNRLTTKISLIEVNKAAQRIDFSLQTLINGALVPASVLPLTLELLWLLYRNDGQHVLRAPDGQSWVCQATHSPDGVFLKVPQPLGKRLFLQAPRTAAANELFIDFCDIEMVIETLEAAFARAEFRATVVEAYNPETGELITASQVHDYEVAFDEAERDLIDYQLSCEVKFDEQGGPLQMKNRKQILKD